ncbi:MAG: MATE family efflux transporter [Pseudomonadota bacterium]
MKPRHFVDGSILRHIFGMAHTSMLALIALVAVDALDLFFLSLLGDVEIVAALGFAWPVIFFTLAVSLGISIAMTALVAKAEGHGDRARARIYATHIIIVGLVLSLVMTAVLWFAVPGLLSLFGATGRVHELGQSYVRIVVICLPVLILSMSSGALLRAIGAKQRAMNAKLVGAAVNAILDPIFIFGFDWGVEGAAWATVISRLAIMAVALDGATRVHRMLGRFDARLFWRDCGEIGRITVPVTISKAGAPAGSAFVMATMAQFGDHAVAAVSIIERIAPFVFVGLYALPQAIGPIIGQNFAAGEMARVRTVWHDAFGLIAVYMAVVWAGLFLFQDGFAALFRATDETAFYLVVFCSFIAPLYLFQGLQFISQTFFNVTGRSWVAMLLDLAKELLGVVPFVWLGSQWFGAVGVLAGQGVGMVVFGTISALVGYGLIRQKPDRGTVAMAK